MSATSLGFSDSRLERLTAWLEAQVESERFAGVSALIGRHGERAYCHATGYADAERQVPFKEDTLVRIYSMTKPVTAVAAMQLYERGCFQLDDKLADYLPEFAQLQVWRGGDAPLKDTVPLESAPTIKQVMSHTAGFTYDFMQTTVVDAAYREARLLFPGTSASLASAMEQLAQLPLLCQPGSAWNYSVASDVLGRLVEVWSGQSLDAYLREALFEPLGMNETGFNVPAGLDGRFASCYAPKSGKTLGGIAQPANSEQASVTGYKLQDDAHSSAFLQPAPFLSGGGGLVSTLGDYGRFCEMLRQEGTFEGEQLLSPRTVRYMRTNQLPGNRDMAAMGQPVWSETSYNGIGFGLGFAVVLDPVEAAIITNAGEHHWGGAASTFFWIDPAEDLYCIFLTQLIPSSSYPVRRELRTLVYQALVD